MKRICACYFDGIGTTSRFSRMARVFEHTVRQHCRTWKLTLTRLEPPARRVNIGDNQIANTAKLAFWCDFIARVPDGDEVLLIDVDTIILKPLDDVWDQPFDLAYTVRTKGFPNPLNGGVVFMRVNTRSRAWMEEWRKVNDRMITDRDLYQKWRRYSGLNQRAFGLMLETWKFDGQLLALPCQEWNCEDSAWAQFDKRTRILHIKSALRSAIPWTEHTVRTTTPHLRSLARRWSALERAATGVRA